MLVFETKCVYYHLASDSYWYSKESATIISTGFVILLGHTERTHCPKR
jgi:hypothetical protein